MQSNGVAGANCRRFRCGWLVPEAQDHLKSFEGRAGECQVGRMADCELEPIFEGTLHFFYILTVEHLPHAENGIASRNAGPLEASVRVSAHRIPINGHQMSLMKQGGLGKNHSTFPTVFLV